MLKWKVQKDLCQIFNLKERVLRYLQDFGSITSWEAIQNFGATRLSAIIFLLKKDGYKFDEEWITKINRYGEDELLTA